LGRPIKRKKKGKRNKKSKIENVKHLLIA